MKEENINNNNNNERYCLIIFQLIIYFYWFLSISVSLLVVLFPSLSALHRYGKLRDEEKKKQPENGLILSYLSDITVPKRYFTHFYIIGSVWSCGLMLNILFNQKTIEENLQYPLCDVTFFLVGGDTLFTVLSFIESLIGPIYIQPSPVDEDISLISSFILFCFLLHTMKRLYECLFISVFGSRSRMNIAGYLIGMSFYIAAPFTIYEILIHSNINKSKMNIQTICFLVGLFLFVYGSIHQSRCHKILARLRNDISKHDSHLLPNGDWFKYVSSPHYLAEIVIYVGIAIMVSSHTGKLHLSLYLMIAFTIINLSITANGTHQWYLDNFKDKVPKERRRIIPFLF